MKKKIFLTFSIIILCSFLLNAENLSNAKGIITLVSGKYEVDISSECKYTIAEVRWDGYRVIPRNGYNGTVMIYNDGMVGCGHTEGGKIEEVKAIEFLADGRPFLPEDGKTYSASTFSIRKISRLDEVLVTGEILISAFEIKIDRSLEAIGEQKIINLYLFMFCFSSKFKEWTASLPDAKKLDGIFTDNGNWMMTEDVKSAALFDSVAGKGIGIVYPEIVKGKNKKSAFWDKPNYHKFYLFLDIPSSVKKGFAVPRKSIILRAFSADSKNWKTTAQEILSK